MRLETRPRIEMNCVARRTAGEEFAWVLQRARGRFRFNFTRQLSNGRAPALRSVPPPRTVSCCTHVLFPSNRNIGGSLVNLERTANEAVGSRQLATSTPFVASRTRTHAYEITSDDSFAQFRRRVYVCRAKTGGKSVFGDLNERNGRRGAPREAASKTSPGGNQWRRLYGATPNQRFPTKLGERLPSSELNASQRPAPLHDRQLFDGIVARLIRDSGGTDTQTHLTCSGERHQLDTAAPGRLFANGGTLGKRASLRRSHAQVAPLVSQSLSPPGMASAP